MKHLLLTLLAGMLLVAGCTTKPSRVLRHVVMLDFKEGTSQAKMNALALEFASLPENIDAIYDFEWGIDITEGKKTQGHTHFFVVTFRDQAGLDIYRPHPAHRGFVANLKPNLEKVLVIDYWAAP